MKESQQKQGHINLITALPCEAKLLVKYLALIKIREQQFFEVYSNKQRSIFLIVSGVGKTKVAAAIAYLSQLTGNLSYAHFINIGIAGHATLPLGSLKIINKISDVSSNRDYFPRSYLLSKIEEEALTTHEKMQNEYVGLSMIDMEGSAFFSAANIFVTQEQIHLLKIVSDNNDNHTDNINSKIVCELVNLNMEEISGFIGLCQQHSEQEQQLQQAPRGYKNLLATASFSHYQQHELKESLRKWECLHDSNILEKIDLTKNSKSILRQIESITYE